MTGELRRSRRREIRQRVRIEYRNVIKEGAVFFNGDVSYCVDANFHNGMLQDGVRCTVTESEVDESPVGSHKVYQVEQVRQLILDLLDSLQ